jgi:hypothetical protein
MSKKGRATDRRERRAAARKRNASGQGSPEPAAPDEHIDSMVAKETGQNHTDDQKTATPVAHSKEARAAKMRAKRRRGQWTSRLRRTVIGLGIGVPVVLVLAFTGGLFEPHLGVEASNEGGVGRHVAQGRELSPRNRPPSSGIHYGGTSRYSVSATPIPPGNWIHNLEHGGVVILYRCDGEQACAEAASRVRTEVGNVARAGAFGQVKIVGSPYQDMETPFTAVAWGRTLPLDEFDPEQLLAFYDRYVDRGPEQAA